MPRKWPKYSRVFTQARSNAKRRGIPFTLTEADFAALVERSGGRCMLTGLPFDEEYKADRIRPYAASLDRTDSSGGYTPDNVRLVCAAANIALGDTGTEVFARLAEGLYGGELNALRTENELLRARLAEYEDTNLAPMRGCLRQRPSGRWEYRVHSHRPGSYGQRVSFYGATAAEALAKARVKRYLWD